MLVTAICDVFRTDERGDIRDAAVRLIRDDEVTWSPYGVYVFWQPDDREVLYVGIDSNLPHRFAQHTGLLPAPPSDSKVDQVNGWFDEHDELGISFVIQSAISRPGFGTTGDDSAQGAMKYGEGQLIAAVQRRTGDLPPWNEIGGALAGQRHTQEASEELAGFDRAVTGHHDSLFLARLRLRDLAENSLAQTFEELLHAARLDALFGSLGQGADSQDVLKALEHVIDLHPDLCETAELMVRSNYLEASPIEPVAGQVKRGLKTALASYYLSPNPASDG